MPVVILFLILSVCGSALAETPWPPKNFSCYYGGIDQGVPSKLGRFELLVVHPGKEMDNLTPAKVERLRATGVPKTVIGYVSVGESEHSPGGPPRASVKRSGPTFVDSQRLDIELHRNLYQSRYLDQRAFVFGEDGFLTFGPNGKPILRAGQDGQPDENGVWGSYYVKASDPGWQAHIFKRLEELDKLGLDGFFLDTVDTASPWGDYGWTSSGMLELVEKIRKAYPNKRIVANRGLFYFSRTDKYAGLIDGVLFESLLTLYQHSLKRAVVTPWVEGHVEVLDEALKPAQSRTGVHLLVLEYVDPQQQNLVRLVQSIRSLLGDTPYSLSFSHPSLQIPGWTAEDFLSSKIPAWWPTVKDMVATEESQPGFYSLRVRFDGPVPADAISDLRVTDDDELDPKRAAQLPLVEILSQKVEGNVLHLRARGLDKETEYRLFFRLVSNSMARATPFAWTRVETRSSELPGQVREVSSTSDRNGLLLKFSTPSSKAPLYRVYRRSGSRMLAESTTTIVAVSGLEVGEAADLYVVGVNSEGVEGYPSAVHTAFREDVVPPPVPGVCSVEGSTVSWAPVEGAESYRLYVVPEKDSFRLPLISEETKVELEDVLPGRYQLFLTSVDDSGNQSRPGPKFWWTSGP